MRQPLRTPIKRKRVNVRRLLFWSTVGVFVAAVIYLMNQPWLFIKSIEARGLVSISDAELTQSVDEYLSSYWLGIIPRRNQWFVQPKRLVRQLKQVYPKFRSVTISVEQHVLRLLVDERSPDSLWCQEPPSSNEFEENCYFADRDGRWYAEAPYLSENVLPKVYLDQQLDTLIPGEQYLKPEDYQDFFLFLGSLEHDYHLKIYRTILLPQGDIKLELKELQGVSYKGFKPTLFFSMEDSYDLVNRNLGITLTQPAFAEVFNARPLSLRSIDLRFDGRSFFTFEPA